MRNSKIILLLVTISISLLSCKKERLTKATKNGANTFSCKVDGKVFVANDIYSVPITPKLVFYYSEPDKKLQIIANAPSDKDGEQKHFLFNLANLQTGRNVLNDKNKAQVVISRKFQLDEYFCTSSSVVGVLTITLLDTSSNIVSGTFSFQAVSRTNSSSVVNITEGRFDGKY